MARLLSPRIPFHELPESCFFTKRNFDGFDWYVCHTGLLEYFDVPKSVTAIQLECNTSRTRHSIKVTAVDRGMGLVWAGTGNQIALSPEPLNAAFKFWDKHGPFYVKCYYWED